MLFFSLSLSLSLSLSIFQELSDARSAIHRSFPYFPPPASSPADPLTCTPTVFCKRRGEIHSCTGFDSALPLPCFCLFFALAPYFSTLSKFRGQQSQLCSTMRPRAAAPREKKAAQDKSELSRANANWVWAHPLLPGEGRRFFGAIENKAKRRLSTHDL